MVKNFKEMIYPMIKDKEYFYQTLADEFKLDLEHTIKVKYFSRWEIPEKKLPKIIEIAHKQIELEIETYYKSLKQ